MNCSRRLLWLPLLAPAFLRADVQLPKILGSHMVIQRDMPVHVWGWADPGEKVEVSFDGKSAEAVADRIGKWSASLAPHAAGGPFQLTVRGNNRITLDEVMVGDVWFASGQSNMEMPLKGFPPDATINNGAAEIQNANQPRLRLLRIRKNASMIPLADYSDSWTTCTPETAAEFSAVAYFFGRSIANRENVTVGLIDSTWGGTPAEAWTSFEGLSSDASLMPVFAAWGNMVRGYTDMPQIRLMEKREDEAAERAHAPKPKHPWRGSPESWQPAGLYNAMVAPAIAYGIRGVIWYQGEANASAERAGLYQKLFTAMISDWRSHWREGNFPFLFVQLANFKGGEYWPTLREAQRRTLALRNTGMAVTIDVGNPENIHPGDKQTVGERLALAARHIAYGEQLEYSGPVFRQAAPEGTRLRVYFDHAEGLMAKNGVPASFEIAGEDHKYSPATAEIDGQTVVLNSQQVAAPRYVRYAWRDLPEANLYNGANLPASPFSSEEMLPLGIK